MSNNADWFTESDKPTPKTDRLPQPAGWRILVRPLSPKAKTAGGIIIPEQSQDIQAYLITIGEVLLVGPLCYLRQDMKDGEAWTKPGDFVLYGKMAGLRIEVDGVKILVLNDDEVLARVPAIDAIKRL